VEQGISFVRLIERSRGIGIRIAGITMLLVVLSLVLPAIVISSYLNSALERHVSERIREEMSTLLGPTGSNDPKAVIEAIKQRSQTSISRQFIYRIATTDGERIAGDARITTRHVGWDKTVIPDAEHAGGGITHLLILTKPLRSNFMVSVGREVLWISTVEEKLGELMVWGLLGGLLLAAITAYLVKRLIARRLDIISNTAVAIMDGDLSHRMPLTGADDDFDRLSSTLNAALERMQELLNSLQQVSSDIAHDLRTPLGRMLQGLERVRREAAAKEEYAKAIDRAIAETEALLATFTALLRIAQIEGGARRSALREVDLGEILESLVEAYELSAEDASSSLTTGMNGHGKIRGDRDLLVQMFANLIENSLTHTPAGSNIVVSLDETPDAVTASVCDDGPGVPENEREKIFQRFYRLETSRTSPGTGLGLSLVAAVAKLHGAKIEVLNTHPGLRIAVTFIRSKQA
jgi:signal transduction histidine kinase